MYTDDKHHRCNALRAKQLDMHVNARAIADIIKLCYPELQDIAENSTVFHPITEWSSMHTFVQQKTMQAI